MKKTPTFLIDESLPPSLAIELRKRDIELTVFSIIKGKVSGEV
jgi:hypothetical protein